MDTRLLEYFLAIAEEGNMTRATENLHVTQPTLSKHVMKLEKLLNTDRIIHGGSEVNREMVEVSNEARRLYAELNTGVFTDEKICAKMSEIV